MNVSTKVDELSLKKSKPILLFLVSEGKYFLSHRLSLAQAAKEAAEAAAEAAAKQAAKEATAKLAWDTSIWAGVTTGLALADVYKYDMDEGKAALTTNSSDED